MHLGHCQHPSNTSKSESTQPRTAATPQQPRQAKPEFVSITVAHLEPKHTVLRAHISSNTVTSYNYRSTPTSVSRHHAISD